MILLPLVPQVLTLNSFSEHVAHVFRKTWKKSICADVNKTVNITYSLPTCASYSELPSSMKPCCTKEAYLNPLKHEGGGGLYALPFLFFAFYSKYLQATQQTLKILDPANLFVANDHMKKKSNPSDHFENSVQKPPMPERVKGRIHLICIFWFKTSPSVDIKDL